ncbi:Hypothetical_protein [Hexamita inflata]|uniref:Hypothetical_protein n=1 Tax=Hexamita inflata TaxID=28002 RepID=A0AA86PIL4_9EUKA|nr:Hypothetical protein HINF_LOCUS26818 [Hexamita inflata]CAI9939176.1 Hypothetical protein HINF_LOCUS26821 [Hexamita inflata]CAI9939179.1 Hypothetical protein HINF_LOCUS26824 [Hexamita inflata]
MSAEDYPTMLPQLFKQFEFNIQYYSKSIDIILIDEISALVNILPKLYGYDEFEAIEFVIYDVVELPITQEILCSDAILSVIVQIKYDDQLPTLNNNGEKFILLIQRTVEFIVKPTRAIQPQLVQLPIIWQFIIVILFQIFCISDKLPTEAVARFKFINI